MRQRSFPSDDPFKSVLVGPVELSEQLERQSAGAKAARIVPLSAAWFLPNDPEGRTGRSSFEKRRMANSQLFDLDEVCDRASPWPHMLPTASEFARCMGALGVRRSDCVVFYDTAELGLFSAPRAAWTLTHFGHERVHVLNNFRLWVESGRPTVSGSSATAEPAEYEVPHGAGTPGLSLGLSDMQGAVKSNLSGDAEQTKIIDARPAGRWAGSAPEPRAGIPSGHMPTSISLPFTDVLDPQHKAMLAPDQLGAVFRERLGLPSARVISSCGTGVTAAVVDLALEVAGYAASGERKIYDGSWTEWATTLKDEEGWIRKS